HVSVIEWTSIVLDITGPVGAMPLYSHEVLIDRDDFLVQQDGAGVGRHGAHVVAGQQRRGEDGPEAHVGAVFVGGHAAVADLQHVRIVPVSGAGVFRDRGLRIDNFHHALVGVVDIAGGAPQIAADERSPLPHVGAAVLAEAVDDGAIGGAQRVAHLLVHGAHGGVGIKARCAAPVVLK